MPTSAGDFQIECADWAIGRLGDALGAPTIRNAPGWYEVGPFELLWESGHDGPRWSLLNPDGPLQDSKLATCGTLPDVFCVLAALLHQREMAALKAAIDDLVRAGSRVQ